MQVGLRIGFKKTLYTVGKILFGIQAASVSQNKCLIIIMKNLDNCFLFCVSYQSMRNRSGLGKRS